MKQVFVLLCSLCISLSSLGQQRMQVVIDNDFAGDPDGLFALAQLMTSTSVDVKCIVGSHLHEKENWAESGKPSATTAVKEVKKLQDLMGKSWNTKIVQGSNVAMSDSLKPVLSDGAKAIVEAAMACDSRNPLYVLCGGGLTEIASAWLRNPEIAERCIVVWIGGEEYPGMMKAPGDKPEYNTTIDVVAAKVVFNRSNLHIWQVPRNAYRQCLISYPILERRLKGNPVGEYLLKKISHYVGQGKNSESYVLGDSPLVLLSALQTNWERDPASSVYSIHTCPKVNEKGRFVFGDEGRKIRVYDRLDTYLMFEDMFAKIGNKQY